MGLAMGLAMGSSTASAASRPIFVTDLEGTSGVLSHSQTPRSPPCEDGPDTVGM